MIKVNGHTAGIKFVNNGIGNATVKEGTFTSADTQFGIVDVSVGFKPDLVMIRLPFGNNDTTAYWEKDISWAETKSIWNLNPAEPVAYLVDLGRQSGETGIQSINDDGFSFMSNGGNTQGVTCEYVAVKYEAEQPTPDETILFKDGQWYNTDKIEIVAQGGVINSDGYLEFDCSSDVCGIYVNNLNFTDPYSIMAKVANINESHNFTAQYGNSVVGVDARTVVTTGQGRGAYATVNLPYTGEEVTLPFIKTDNTNTTGIFIGGYAASNDIFVIKEMKILR